MKVIVTGGTGYLGSHTVLDLLKNNHDVLVIDNLYNSNENVVDLIQEISGKKIKFRRADLRDLGIIKSIFKKYKPDVVLHFAGLKSVEESIKKPESYYENNVVGTKNLLQAMDDFGCNKIVFTSSATVYGNPNHLPVDENHPLNPVNPYGVSKYLIEELIKKWTLSKRENTSLILRCFNPIGAHESGLLGESPRNKLTNLLPIIANVAFSNTGVLKIFGNNYQTKDGTCERDFVCITDIARAHLLASELSDKLGTCEIINIGSGISTSVLELVNIFENVIGKKINKSYENVRNGDVASIYADNKKAEKLLNWKVLYECKHGCETFWNWKKKSNG